MLLVAGLCAVLGGSALSAAAPSVAVVAESDAAVDADQAQRVVARLAAHLSATGATVLSNAELVQRLTGTPSPRTTAPDIAALESLLSSAEAREGYFDDAAAEALRRQVMDAYESTLWPNPTLRRVAAEAARDLAIGAFTGGDMNTAATRARDAWRRFGLVPIDPRKHSPKIEKFFEDARAKAERMPRTTLHVLSDSPGTIYAEGVGVGHIEGDAVVKLPLGAYRVWVVGAAGMSLPYPVSLDGKWAELRIDTKLDQRLSLGNPVSLRCETSCADDLSSLAARSGVARLYGVRAGKDGAIDVWVRDVEKRASYEATFTDALGLVPVPVGRAFPRFSGWYLMPFGGGQFAQHRPMFGSMYLAAQAGLFAWHLSARSRHGAAQRGDDLLKEERTRKEANLALSLFVGAVAAGLVEAVVVGRLYGVEATMDVSQIDMR